MSPPLAVPQHPTVRQTPARPSLSSQTVTMLSGLASPGSSVCVQPLVVLHVTPLCRNCLSSPCPPIHSLPWDAAQQSFVRKPLGSYLFLFSTPAAPWSQGWLTYFPYPVSTPWVTILWSVVTHLDCGQAWLWPSGWFPSTEKDQEPKNC